MISFGKEKLVLSVLVNHESRISKGGWLLAILRLPGSEPGLLTVARDGPHNKIYRISVFNKRTTELNNDVNKKAEKDH
jgi:hypothetical protein